MTSQVAVMKARYGAEYSELLSLVGTRKLSWSQALEPGHPGRRLGVGVGALRP